MAKRMVRDYCKSLEIWKLAVCSTTGFDFPNYEVSNFGNIRNSKGNYLKHVIDKSRLYPYVKLSCGDGSHKKIQIHR